ncbi:MAG: hydantoinase B/oxoprolinase family protein [Nitrospinota bacterium]
MAVDPVTLAVVKANLEFTADEMDAAMIKTSFSPVIAEGHDRANGIYGGATGEVIAQGDDALPIFVGAMQFTVQATLQAIQDYAPGDIFMVNDPYTGGTHLMDVSLLNPFYYQGELFAWLANTGHWPDIGGSAPGGFVSKATEIFQEGLRLPPVRLFRRGELNEDVLNLVLANIRVPDERIGDIKAAVNALHVGEVRLKGILDKYGVDTVRECIAEMKAHSEKMMRAHVEAIPDGTYTFEDYMDSDGVINEPLTIHCEMTVKDSDMHLDFSRTSPPCKGPTSSVLSNTIAAFYVAIKHVFTDVPVNSGMFAPFRLNVPDTTFLNSKFPKPCAACTAEVGQRVVDVVFGCLAQAIPDKLFGAPFSTNNDLVVGGTDPESGKDYVIYIYQGGGYGGSRSSDGLTNGASTIGISRVPPAELYEQRYPFRVNHFKLFEDSAGSGWRRGGFGTSYKFELLRGEGFCSVIGDRGKFPPFGILGGKPARLSEIIFTLDGKEYRPEHVTKDTRVPLKPGDTLEVHSPGGGGYGDPLERDLASVQGDVRGGRVFRETAERDYGVVFQGDSLEIDFPASEARRKELLGKPGLG